MLLPYLPAGEDSDEDRMDIAGEPRSRLCRGEGLRLVNGLWRLTSSTSTSDAAVPPSSVKIAAALSSTLGTLSSVDVFALGMRWGFCCWACGGDPIVSMSRSKMADDDECTDVGDDGIDLGEMDPCRTGEVDKWLGDRCIFAEGMSIAMVVSILPSQNATLASLYAAE